MKKFEDHQPQHIGFLSIFQQSTFNHRTSILRISTNLHKSLILIVTSYLPFPFVSFYIDLWLIQIMIPCSCIQKIESVSRIVTCKHLTLFARIVSAHVSFLMFGSLTEQKSMNFRLNISSTWRIKNELICYSTNLCIISVEQELLLKMNFFLDKIINVR